IPSGRPPHKQRDELARYAHRFAMTGLACADHPHFISSLAEAGSDFTGRQVFYSIDTVRHFRHIYNHRGDKLFFILGADSFLEIATWREYEALLNTCDFIVASRPGFRTDALRLVIPPALLGRPRDGDAPESHATPLRRPPVHLPDTSPSHVSATEVRQRLDRGQSSHGLVPLRVE